MSARFPVIDLFAGPGGLGEGFSACRRGPTGSCFDARLSIEMDATAHQTLLLRKFYRAFDEAPEAYFDYIRGCITRQELFARYRDQHHSAQKQAWRIELGRCHPTVVTRRVRAAVAGATSWVLIGGPPCQAYSLVGRSRMQSRTNPAFEDDHRHFLYREYLRIVAKHLPPVFVMENVKGLLSATHGGERIFARILSDLRQPVRALGIRGPSGLRYKLYSVGESHSGRLALGEEFMSDSDSFIVRSELYGIPQARHRVFVLGVREDLPSVPNRLQESTAVSVSDVIADLPRLRSTLSRGQDSIGAWRATVGAVISQRWFRQPINDAMRRTAREARQALSTIRTFDLENGGSWLPYTDKPAKLSQWYRAGCRGISNHESRGHMPSDLQRYFFAACFARAHGRSPTLDDFPTELMPDHRNAEMGRQGQMFSDRFRVQLPDRPATTVTSHISKDGNYFVHFDPTQCRSLTVREAARIQTFPDSYFFEGPRTEQYHQVGNAVPPLLAVQLANIVYDLLVRSEGRRW